MEEKSCHLSWRSCHLSQTSCLMRRWLMRLLKIKRRQISNYMVASLKSLLSSMYSSNTKRLLPKCRLPINTGVRIRRIASTPTVSQEVRSLSYLVATLYSSDILMRYLSLISSLNGGAARQQESHSFFKKITTRATVYATRRIRLLSISSRLVSHLTLIHLSHQTSLLSRIYGGSSNNEGSPGEVSR